MNRNWMLAIITALLSVHALRISYPVTMPIAAAAVVIAAVWPVKPWLDRMLPSSIATTGTVIVLLLIVFGFLAALNFSAAQVVGETGHPGSCPVRHPVQGHQRGQSVFERTFSRIKEFRRIATPL